LNGPADRAGHFALGEFGEADSRDTAKNTESVGEFGEADSPGAAKNTESVGELGGTRLARDAL